MIFIRHPRVSAPQDLCYGRLEVPLGPNAESEITDCLEVVPIGRPVVSSPMLRCRELATRLAARDGSAPRWDIHLSEYHFGAWEGMAWPQIPRALSEKWTNDLLNEAPPGGERFASLIERVQDALAEMPTDAIIVAHAGPIRAARMLLTCASFEAVFAQPIPYATPLSLTREAA